MVPEVPLTVPVVEVEDSPSRVVTPEAQVVKEPAIEVRDEPPSVAEPVVEDCNAPEILEPGIWA